MAHMFRRLVPGVLAGTLFALAADSMALATTKPKRATEGAEAPADGPKPADAAQPAPPRAVDRPVSKVPEAEAAMQRGRAAMGRGDQAAAEKHFGDAMRLDPKFSPACASRAYVRSLRHEYRKAIDDYREAVRLDPTDVQSIGDRGVCHLHLKEYQQCMAAMDEALKLKPDSPRYLGMHGACRLYLGDYDEGAAEVKKAIAMNAGDLGVAYRPDRDTKPGEAQLAEGRKQVERMLKDRPAMAQYAEATQALRDWAIRKFAGEDLGEPIRWDPTPPRDSDAEHYAPLPGSPGRILIDANYRDGPNRGKPRKFEELWAGAVFELHNIGYAKRFVQLHDQARKGRITKREFVAGIWGHEHQAMQQTRAFYVDQFVPLMKGLKLATDPDLWFAVQWDDAKKGFEKFLDPHSYPWRPYARMYDWFTAKREYHASRFKVALAVLEQMAVEKEYPDEAAEVQRWLGRCQIELKQWADAVGSLSRAIELDPASAEGYRLRAMAYEGQGKTQEAAADTAKSRELRGRGRR